MTVKEIVGILKEAKEIKITWENIVHQINILDPFILEAFGDYLVDGVYAWGDGKFEIELAVRPVKRV